MHPFPPAASLEPFKGDAIVQVWLDPHGVRFLFKSGRQIYAEASIEQVEPDGQTWAYACAASDGAPVLFHRLLYGPIVTVDREAFRLTFGFGNGARLILCSEAGLYESGHIMGVDGTITVF